MRKYPSQQFVLNADATEKFVTLTPAISCIEALSVINVVLCLTQRDANFQARIAIRKATSPTAWGAWTTIAPTSGTYVTDAGTANEKVWRFDPNGAGGGDIDSGAAVFQLGIGYSASTGQASGTVLAHTIGWR
jgi:hypothetical protein